MYNVKSYENLSVESVAQSLIILLKYIPCLIKIRCIIFISIITFFTRNMVISRKFVYKRVVLNNSKS